MAENVNPDVDSGVDKQKVLKEIMSTQDKQPESKEEQIPKKDDKPPLIPSKVDSEKQAVESPSASKSQSVPTSYGLWASIKEHRREVATLFTLLVGLVWLLIAYYTKQAIPLLIAAVLLAPNIFYISQFFKKKPVESLPSKDEKRRKQTEDAD